MADTIPLYALRPLGLKTPDEIAKLIGSHTGFETLAVREDATIGQLCDVMSQALHQAWGMAALMETDGNADGAICAWAGALAALIGVVRDHLAVVRDGIGDAVVPGVQKVQHG